MLDILHQDHINIAKLLNVLRDILAAIRSENPVRFNLLRDVLSYLREVADTHHHPREDLIYEYFTTYRCSDPSIVTTVLKEQHKQIVRKGEDLQELVAMILMDAVIPLDSVATALGTTLRIQLRRARLLSGQVLTCLFLHRVQRTWYRERSPSHQLRLA